MKSFLAKCLSLITIFSMVSFSNIATAITTDIPVDQDENVCETQTLVSTPGENGGVAVDPHHSAWTASISGADWIWSENPIADPVAESIETFTRTFNVTGVPVDGELEIAADNTYKVSLNGNLPFVVDVDEDNYSATDSVAVPASQLVTGENTIEFEVTNMSQEGGTMESNPAGLLYKLTVNCSESPEDPEEDDCPIVYARVKFSKVSNGAAVDGWRNWVPGGDLEPQAFVGGSLPENTYGDEVWFPLTNQDGTVIVDTDLAPYADVPGLAIERQDGKVRLVLYGNHNTDNNEVGGKEFTHGVIELQGATWQPGMQTPLDWSDLNTNPRTHDPLLNDSVFPMDSRGTFSGYINQYDYRFDRMRTYTPTKVEFHLVVTTGSDGFYASYDIDQDCDGEEDPEDPGCESDCGEEPTCEETQTCNEDPTCEEEPCDQDPTCEVNCEEVPTCEETQTCETGDDDGDDTGDDDEEGGGGGSSGSRRSSGGGGGEVLGAETSMCTWDVNTYMRKGYKNDPTQVMILQRDLLNGYMNAGIVVDGIYGPSTEAAVKAFQAAKGDKILKPWYNLFQPTGIFYKTTLVEAKNTICPDEILPVPTDLIDWSQNPGEVPPKI